MTRSGILLITVAFMVVTASLASTAYAICSKCGGGEQDWSASANNFIEGKPINDTPSSLSNPQQNRLMNSDFSSNLLKGNSGNPANNPNNLAQTSTFNTSTFNISLMGINAMPNPANSGSPVMITTNFGNNSSNSQSVPETNMTAYATIKNSAGVAVGKVNLERISGEEYAGIWNADVTAGAYRATIVVSVPGASKTFNDALQIEVSGSKK